MTNLILQLGAKWWRSVGCSEHTASWKNTGSVCVCVCRVTSPTSLSAHQRKWDCCQQTWHTWLYLVLWRGIHSQSSSLPLVVLSWDCSANKSTSLDLLSYLFIEIASYMIPWSWEKMGILYSTDNGSQRKLSRYICKIFQSGNLVSYYLFFIKMQVHASHSIYSLEWSQLGKARFKPMKYIFKLLYFKIT